MDKDLPLLSIEHLNSLLPVIPADQYPILKNIFIHAPVPAFFESVRDTFLFILIAQHYGAVNHFVLPSSLTPDTITDTR